MADQKSMGWIVRKSACEFLMTEKAQNVCLQTTQSVKSHFYCISRRLRLVTEHTATNLKWFSIKMNLTLAKYNYELTGYISPIETHVWYVLSPQLPTFSIESFCICFTLPNMASYDGGGASLNQVKQLPIGTPKATHRIQNSSTKKLPISWNCISPQTFLGCVGSPCQPKN